MRAFVRRRRALDSLTRCIARTRCREWPTCSTPRSYSRGADGGVGFSISLAQFPGPNSQFTIMKKDARTGQVELIEKDRREIKVKKMTPEKKGGPGVRLGVRINCRTGSVVYVPEKRGRVEPSRVR